MNERKRSLKVRLNSQLRIEIAIGVHLINQLEVELAIGEENAIDVESLPRFGLKDVSPARIRRVLLKLAKKGIVALKGPKVWLLPEWWKRL